MNNDFLRRLYWECSSGIAPFTDESRNLSALYERTPEAGEASERLDKALRETNLDKEMVSAIEDLSGDELVAYEIQGFINGFRLGDRKSVV